MASIYHLFENAESIIPQIIQRDEFAEHDRIKKYVNETKLHNQWLSHLQENETLVVNAAAINIQRFVRGWLVRWHLPKYYKDYIDRLRNQYYNEMATKIQKAWRVYRAHRLLSEERLERIEKENLLQKGRRYPNSLQQGPRKNFKELLLDSTNGTNNIFLSESEQKFQIQEEEKRKKEEEDEAKEMVLFILFKLHHLVRTATCEGIFSLHGKRELSYLEKLLKAVPVGPYMKNLRKRYNRLVKELEKIPPEPTKFGGWLGKYEIMYRNKDKSREIRDPPISDHMVHKKQFVLNTRLAENQYVRELLTQEKYLPNGNKVEFRVEEPWKDLSCRNFDLNTLKVIRPKESVPPYHIDFWSSLCESQTK